ncbi:hypothetical protein I7I48_07178 [Histoplasma ohiense]|nr:hypothetical protein I7I48_07178 [Histoplasma ohiense (nom. inval.)]
MRITFEKPRTMRYVMGVNLPNELFSTIKKRCPVFLRYSNHEYTFWRGAALQPFSSSSSALYSGSDYIGPATDSQPKAFERSTNSMS